MTRLHDHLAEAIKDPDPIRVGDHLICLRFETMQVHSALGAVRHLLAMDQERRYARVGKAGLQHRAMRVCGLAACGVGLEKGPNESWLDYLHRTTCCPAHRNQYRAEVRARARAQAQRDEGP